MNKSSSAVDGDDYVLLLQLGRPVLHVVFLSSEHSIAKAMIVKSQQYDAKRASGSEATLLGAPHHHVWATMILEMVKFFTALKLPLSRQQDLHHLKEYAESIASPKDLEDLVHVCRMCSAHQE
eukprot:5897426-Heterocapsa_arctica.AAC.1